MIRSNTFALSQGALLLAAALSMTGALAAQDAVVDRSRPRTLSADSTFFAEGLDVDRRDGTLYLTSIRHRNVYRVGAGGALTPVLASNLPDVGAVMGVRVDGARGLLWLTTAGLVHMRDHRPADSTMSALLAVRLADGSVAGRWRLGDGTGIPGEIALTSTGVVLVSDGSKGVLYRLRAPEAALETIRPAGLRSPQGIAVNAAGTVAWVADYSRGLHRWDLATDSVVRVTNVDGRSIPGIDGLLVAPDGRLIGVHNGGARPQILAVTLNAAGTGLVDFATLDQQPSYEGEPTVGVLIGDLYVFVASSAWRSWTETGQRKDPAQPLPAVVLRSFLLERE